jgi:hypothetical protein
MARTNSTLVQQLLGNDYQSGRSLVPFIATASSVVNRVSTCATGKGVPLSAAELELVERWLACHYYTKSDPTYASRSTAGASGAFTRDPNDYKQAAIELDYSGCLKAILAGARAGLTWLGKVPSEQIDVRDRD